VIISDIIDADFGLTLILLFIKINFIIRTSTHSYHASEKVVTLCSLHACPMDEKVYAEIKPIIVSNADDKYKLDTLSENDATPNTMIQSW